jgi:hypothetical protein
LSFLSGKGNRAAFRGSSEGARRRSKGAKVQLLREPDLAASCPAIAALIFKLTSPIAPTSMNKASNAILAPTWYEKEPEMPR